MKITPPIIAAVIVLVTIGGIAIVVGVPAGFVVGGRADMFTPPDAVVVA
jgi:hypothetical protein